jgi:hypothetical protein
VSSWTPRLRAEKTAPLGKDATCGEGSGVHQSLGFLFLGDGRVAQPDQAFALHVRCAIAEFETLQPSSTFEHVDLAVSITYPAWSSLLKSVAASVACGTEDPFQKVLAQSLADGGVKVLKGSPEQVQSFFRDYFDPPQATFQALTLR